MNNKETEILKYYRNVSMASTELAKKELLKSLLERLYPDATDTIDKMSLGSEFTVFNIPTVNRIKTGRADTQYGRVIIEFENNLKITENHAKDQLIEYLNGNWRSGQEYNFTLISTDCLRWIVYAPSKLYPIHWMKANTF